MIFRQLTLRDDVLLGQFALVDLPVGDEKSVTVFSGIVRGKRRADLESTHGEAAVRLARGKDARGRKVVVPAGAVLWAEPMEGDEGQDSWRDANWERGECCPRWDKEPPYHNSACWVHRNWQRRVGELDG